MHVTDALFICGTDVRQLHYNERLLLQSLDHVYIRVCCLGFDVCSCTRSLGEISQDV